MVDVGLMKPAQRTPKVLSTEAIEPGADPVAPAVGSVGFVCRLDDVYHDNKEERLYVTSKVVGRFRVDRVVADHPFFVAETSEVFDEAIEEAGAGGGPRFSRMRGFGGGVGRVCHRLWNYVRRRLLPRH